MTQESHEPEAKPADETSESTGDEGLDAKLAQPVLKGFEGLDKAMMWAGVFLIVVAGLIVYSSALAIPFHALDRELLVENEALHSVARWPEALDKNSPAPLTLFALALNWAIAPGNPAAFHAVNVLLHLLNGVLVYLLCRRLLGEKTSEAVKMLSGLLFVLHPANVEAVASMGGRAQLLGTFFALVSVLLYLRATRDPKKTGLGYLGLGLLAYVGAFGALESAWCLPLLLFFVEVAANGPRFSARRLIPVLNYFAVLGLIIAAALGAGAGAKIASSVESGEYMARLAGTGQAALRAVWPLNLTVSPAAWQSGIPSMATSVVLSALGLLGAIVTNRYRSVGGTALAWFALALVGGALIVPPEAVMGSKAVYLPLAGLVWCVPWAFSKIPLRPPLRTGAGLICAALILALGVGSYARLALWQSEIELWRDAVRKTPDKNLPKERLGVSYIRKGLRQLADAAVLQESGYESEASQLQADASENLEAGGEVLARVPQGALSAEPLYLLGVAFRRLGDSEAGLDSFLASLRKDASNQACAVEIAQLLQAKALEEDERYGLVRALDYYEYARGLGELSAEALASYATALAETGSFEQAAQVLSAAVKKAEDGAMRFGDQVKGIQTAAQQVQGLQNKVRELQGDYADSDEARLLMAQALVIRKRPLQASYILENVLGRDGRTGTAWVLLGFVRAQMGQTEGFLSEWPRPSASPGQQGRLWVQLAHMCASQGEWDAAETYLLSPSAGMSGVRMPLLSLGVVALQLQQAKRAHDYLERATEAYPEEFAPWMALCDLAMAQGNATAARQYLAEAQERNAPEDEVAKRQERLGGGAPDIPDQSGEVIIR
ncbi:MAG: hypothetical protein R6V12_05190 [Candidatus Hydrogenedentota bacterium]